MDRNFDSPTDDFQTGSSGDQSEVYSWDDNSDDDFTWGEESTQENDNSSGSDNEDDFSWDDSSGNDFTWGEESSQEDDNSSDSNSEDDFSWDEDTSNESNNFADFGSSSGRTGSQSGSDRFDFVNYKGAGVIIAIIFVLLAFVFLFFNSIKITKNDVSQHKKSEQVSQEQGVPSNSVNENTVKEKQGVVSFLEIPASTSLDYSGDVYESNGTIVDKVKYLQGHQVVYCLTVRLVLGSTSEDVKYYCNYASFSSVSNGDLVIVKYQQVQDGYISVNEIVK